MHSKQATIWMPGDSWFDSRRGGVISHLIAEAYPDSNEMDATDNAART
jgi:hypothetical protein